MNSKDQTTLNPKRIYLNSVSSNNSIFNKGMLDDVPQLQTLFYGHYNFGISKTNSVVNYNNIESWLDRDIITNIISVPILKHLCYHIIYNSDGVYYEVYKGDLAVKFYKH